MRLFRSRFLCLAAGLLCLSACGRSEILKPAFTDAAGKSLSLSQTARFPLGREGSFDEDHRANGYILGKPLRNDQALALELEFRPGKAPTSSSPVLSLSLSSRADGAKPFLKESLSLGDESLFFVLPLPASGELRRLDLSLAPGKDPGTPFSFDLVAARVVPAWKGFMRLEEGVRLSPGVSVYLRNGGEHIELSPPFLPSGSLPSTRAGIFLSYGPGGSIGPKGEGGKIVFSEGNEEVLRLKARPRGLETFLPSTLFGAGPALRLDVAFPPGVRCRCLASGLFGEGEAELADFGRILRSEAVGPKYDLYRWDLLPATLVFDFRDYAIQDSYLKRLAFFVEKIGFKGRLASDAELEGLHGWNAHDYRSEDLAAFFEAARSSKFPLNAEERELESILSGRGVIVDRSGHYEAGEGALVSIARESVPYLRTLFLTHESTHAIFFTDPAYRDFVRMAWKDMGKDEKWFWKLYFGWKTYNTADDYLMANEYQAYLLQQTLLQTKDYFTKNAPAQLLEKHPELQPEIEAYMEKFASSFEERAASLDAWLGAKYGFRAGRGSTY